VPFFDVAILAFWPSETRVLSITPAVSLLHALERCYDFLSSPFPFPESRSHSPSKAWIAAPPLVRKRRSLLAMGVL